MEKRFLFELLKVIVEDSSEESSESDSAEIINNSYVERVPKVRCKNYVENVVWQYTDVDFKSHFR